MATDARDTAGIHQALHKIIALHAILVRSAIRKMSEREIAKFVILELPKIDQLFAHMEAHRPVVILSFDRICERLTLRVALNASVVRLHVVEPGRVHDVGLALMLDVVAARTMAFLAPNIPLGD